MLGTSTFNRANFLLDEFIQHKLSEYDKLRNFDYGIGNPCKQVSGLSPYISAGVISEPYVLKKIFKKIKKNNKFVDEVLWRTYWKGWLETRSCVWEKYQEELFHIKEKELYSHKDFIAALKGETNIVPFDDWLRQLLETGYLHNHVRMWFASIWIHYLGIPWQLGAELFLNNLLDADPAVNTLSWRWVAGLQTFGKKYIATENNINKYTMDRYKGFRLPKLKVTPLVNQEITKNEIIFQKHIPNKLGSNVMIFSNNIYPASILDRIDKINFLILVQFSNVEENKSDYVKSFKKKILKEAINFYKEKTEKFLTVDLPTESSKLKFTLKENNIKEVSYEYLNVGQEKYHLDYFFNNSDIKVKRTILINEFYEDAWSYCNKGFFNFKKNIPFLLEKHII